MKPSSLFKSAGAFMLRTPLLTMDDFYKLSTSEDIRLLLKSYYEDPMIKEAIYIASKDLYESLEKGISEANEQSYSSLLRYLLRMSTRATPFGLFSTVAIGNFGASTHLKLQDVNKIKKRVRPDMEWLASAAEEFQKDLESVRNLKVIFNPRSYQSGNRLRLEAFAKGNQKKQALSIKSSYLIHYIAKTAKKPIVFHDLVKSASEAYPKLDAEKIEILIWNLFEKRFLISELAHSLLERNPHRNVLNALSKPEISQKIEKYNQTVPGEGIAVLEELVNQCKATSNHVFQIDSVNLQNDLQLNQRVADEVAESLEFAWRYFSKEGNKQLNAYYNKFLNKYGTAELVPILDLVDENWGLGYPVEEPSSFEDISDGKLSAYIKQLFLEAVRKKESEIVIPNNLSFVREANPFTAPPSFDVFCELIANSQQCVDKGDYQLIVHGATAAMQGGGAFGRFTDLLDASGEAVMTSIFQQEQALEPEVCFVESSYCPQNIRNGNVAIHQNFRGYEINFNFPSSNGAKSIDLDDVYVGANAERLYIISKKLNRELNITYANMLNSTFAPPVLKLLRAISNQKYRNMVFWDWGHLRAFNYLPRVRHKKTILSLACWKLSVDMLGIQNVKDEKSMITKIQSWIEEWALPQFVYLTSLDHKILLDLQNPTHIKELAQELKSKKALLLTERYQIKGCQWIKSAKGGHACEFVIPYVRNPSLKVQQAHTIPKQFEPCDFSIKCKPPGADWLYAKIYVPQEMQEELIWQHLAPFGEAILYQKLAKSWFYIRYVEGVNDHHIRLRFYGEPAGLQEKVLPQLHALSLKLIEERRIKSLELGTYEREIWRYGGPNLIEEAEQIFAADSLSCAQLLRSYSEQNYTLPLYVFAAANIVDLLFYLGCTLEEQISLLERLNTDKKHLEGFKNYNHHLMQLSEEVFKQSSENPDAIVNTWLNCLKPRREALSHFKVKLSLVMGNELSPYQLSIYQSFIHMHCNRLMGADLEKEKKALAYCQHALIKLKHRGFSPRTLIASL